MTSGVIFIVLELLKVYNWQEKYVNNNHSTIQPNIIDVFHFEGIPFNFTTTDKQRLDNYSIEDYCNDVELYGLDNTWNKINYYTLHYNSDCPILNVNNFFDLYEKGLALTNKQQKKDSGQYYTPDDVALVMSSWFNELESENICDVGCGTGKLMLSYLDLIGTEQARKLINAGKIYLYDLDNIALNICKTIFIKKYGPLSHKIQFLHCDFLDKNTVLPVNCKVISNPPYAPINNISPNWEQTQVGIDTKELYSMFMEKILKQSVASVIITPYSFIGGKKFYSLRYLMNNYNGFIVSFDNVPGNIFHGKKHGIFNTNTSNSVRAAITVVKNNNTNKGFRLTPLLRFKTDERKKLLNAKVLEGFLPEQLQLIDKNQAAYFKCHKELQNIYNLWLNKSNGKTVKDILSSTKTNYVLYIPNTCRYFTTASVRELKRTGLMTLYVKDKEVFEFLYCLINSSFAYWWWRIFDGGITYPIGLLNQIPIFFDLLTKEDKTFFSNIFNEMIKIEENCIVTKLNAGAKQENIKFPSRYREKINERIVNILSCNDDYKLLDLLHQNNIFGGKDAD